MGYRYEEQGEVAAGPLPPRPGSQLVCDIHHQLQLFLDSWCPYRSVNFSRCPHWLFWGSWPPEGSYGFSSSHFSKVWTFVVTSSSCFPMPYSVSLTSFTVFSKECVCLSILICSRSIRPIAAKMSLLDICRHHPPHWRKFLFFRWSVRLAGSTWGICSGSFLELLVHFSQLFIHGFSCIRVSVLSITHSCPKAASSVQKRLVSLKCSAQAHPHRCIFLA